MNDTSDKQVKRTDTQRAEDAAYTINHAIACTVTDFASPVIAHGVAKRIFHSHSNLWEWFASEGIGDAVAVPVTIAIERYAPGMTNGIRKGMEKTLGWAFRKSSNREARQWALKNDISPGSKEAKDRAKQIYDYEIEHLPQAAIWTATSLVFNVATQKMFHKYLHKGHDHGHSILEIGGSLIAGKAVSTGGVIAVRAVFPDKAHSWDSFSAKHVFEPLERATGKLLGRKPKEDAGWEKRVSDASHTQQAVASR